MRRHEPSWLLLPLALGIALLAWSTPPLLDEESYLAIAQELNPLRPYDWSRAWQPWEGAASGSSYLYAHPPLHLLWVKALSSLSTASWARWLSGLPWIVLWTVSGLRLAQQLCKRSEGAALLMLACPIALLALPMGWGIDLAPVALSTAALAVWSGPPRWRWLSGLLLGVAGSWKYPALLTLLPLLWWARRDARGGRSALLLGLGVWGLIQAWLSWTYGRPHLLEVLLEAHRIERGPWTARGAGALLRAGLGPLALIAVRASSAPWILLSWVLLYTLLPPLDWGLLGLLQWLLLGASTGVLLQLLFEALRRSPLEQALGLWGLLTLVGVLGHNYADTRYLIPLVWPAALLLARAVERQGGWTTLRQAAMLCWAGLGLACLQTELRFSQDAAALAEQLPEPGEGDYFSGEWSVRAAMESRGWSYWTPTQTLPAGARLITPVQTPSASPAGLTLLRRWSGPSRRGLRLLDRSSDVGLHAETLGNWPLGWGEGPLEELLLWTQAPAP